MKPETKSNKSTIEKTADYSLFVADLFIHLQEVLNLGTSNCLFRGSHLHQLRLYLGSKNLEERVSFMKILILLHRKQFSK